MAATLAWPAAAWGDEWQWPVEGPLAARFSYRESSPFSRGQHRGIEIAAAEGTVVRAACSGRVRFAGSVAGSQGIVSVACGGLIASYLHLGAISVRTAADVAPSQRIGTVGRRSRLYLGARRTDDRFGYVDPLTLLADERPQPLPLLPRLRPRPLPVAAPLGPAPLRAPARVPRAVPAAQPAAIPTAHPQPARLPLIVWLGLGLLGAAVPSWGVRRVRRRRRQPVRAMNAGVHAG